MLQFWTPPAIHKGKRASNQGKKGQNQTFVYLFLSHLGKIGDQKRQKQRYILLLGAVGLPVVALSLGRWWCPLVAGGQAFGLVLTFWGCPRFRGASPSSHRGIFTAGTGRNVAEVRFYLPALVFSREFGRPKGAKCKHIFEIWVQSGCGLWLCLPAVWRVCWCGCVGFWYFITHLNAGACPLVVCSRLFVRLSALCLSCCLQIWLYFAF